MTIHTLIAEKNLSAMDLNQVEEFNEDVNLVKTQFIDKLISENKKLLATLNGLEASVKTQIQTVKRDAALVMERLVADNAWYQDQNYQLKSRLETYLNKEKQSKDQSLSLARERDQANHEKRILSRCVDALREEKTTLDFQAKHFSSAFLTLRNAVITFISHPLTVEAERTDQTWESRIQSEDFKASVIATVQGTLSLKKTLEGIDGHLVQLHLLDPLSTISIHSNNVPAFMGERLVPNSEVLQLKKERALWQRRFFKQQSDVARMKIEQESYMTTLKNKDILITKLQSDRKFSSLQRSKMSEDQVLRNALQIENKQLKQQIKEMQETYRKLANLKRDLQSSPKLVKNTEVNTREQLKDSTLNFLAPAPSKSNITEHHLRRHLSPTIRIEKADGILRKSTSTMKSPTNAQLENKQSSPSLLQKLLNAKPESSIVAESPPQTSRPLHLPSVGVSLADKIVNENKKFLTSNIPSRESQAYKELPFNAGVPHTASFRKIGTTVQQNEYDTVLAREISASAQPSQNSSAHRSSPHKDVIRLGTNFLTGAEETNKSTPESKNIPYAKFLDPVNVLEASKSINLSEKQVLQSNQRLVEPKQALFLSSSPVLQSSDSADPGSAQLDSNRRRLPSKHLHLSVSSNPSPPIIKQRTLTLHKTTPRENSNHLLPDVVKNDSLKHPLLSTSQQDKFSEGSHSIHDAQRHFPIFLQTAPSRHLRTISTPQIISEKIDTSPRETKSKSAAQLISSKQSDQSSLLEKSPSQISSLALGSYEDIVVQNANSVSQFVKVEKHGCFNPLATTSFSSSSSSLDVFHSDIGRSTDTLETAPLNTFITKSSPYNSCMTPTSNKRVLHQISHVLSCNTGSGRLLSKDLNFVLLLLRSHRTVT